MNLKRNKTAYLTLLLSVVSRVVLAQHAFTLKGTVDNPASEGRTVLVSYYDGKAVRFDTTRVHAGTFQITGTLAKPVKALLYIEAKETDGQPQAKKNQMREFFLDSGQTIVTGHEALSANIAGGQAQNDYAALLQQWKGIGWTDGTTDKAVRSAKDRTSLAFIQAHPNSDVSFWLLKELATPNYLAGQHEAVQKVFDKMDATWRASEDAEKIAQLIQAARRLGVGVPAPGFTMADTLGNAVSLSDFRGKYVLLDFWASWCVPCRGENPNVVKAFNQYKDQNFTVLGVSLDAEADRQKWLDAIHKDGLPWTHVSDLKGWKNAAANLYQVKSIPINYLIDPDGKIVAVGLRGEKLGETLQELLTTHPSE